LQMLRFARAEDGRGDERVRHHPREGQRGHVYAAFGGVGAQIL